MDHLHHATLYGAESDHLTPRLRHLLHLLSLAPWFQFYHVWRDGHPPSSSVSPPDVNVPAFDGKQLLRLFMWNGLDQQVVEQNVQHQIWR